MRHLNSPTDNEGDRGENKTETNISSSTASRCIMWQFLSKPLSLFVLVWYIRMNICTNCFKGTNDTQKRTLCIHISFFNKICINLSILKWMISRNYAKFIQSWQKFHTVNLCSFKTSIYLATFLFLVCSRCNFKLRANLKTSI